MCPEFRAHFLTLVMTCPQSRSHFLTLVMTCPQSRSHFLTLVMTCPQSRSHFLTLVMTCPQSRSHFLTLVMTCRGFGAGFSEKQGPASLPVPAKTNPYLFDQKDPHLPMMILTIFTISAASTTPSPLASATTETGISDVSTAES